ncbi:MAG: DUF2079 domain-containing protein [Candidatus Levybacteria bacterium]|nr:DUF2079 domain-containing protein [Candidatus Levybacteria bacterium]
MKPIIFSIIKNLIGWSISVIVLVFIGKVIFYQRETVAASLQYINVELLIYGILSFISYFFLRSYLWQTILRKHGYKIPLKETAFLWAISEINRYIPGNVWSFVKRSVLFSKHTIEKRDFNLALIIEAQFVLLGASVISIFALSFLTDIFIFPDTLRTFIILTVIIFVFLLSSLYIFQFNFLARLKFRTSGDTLAQLHLAAVSVLAFLLYGLGYYFVISSIIFLHPKDFYVFIGFFVFSFLAGYILFITPAGLGVREGVIVLGLMKFMAMPLAAFASIFVRCIIVFSEFYFIILSFIWSRTKHHVLQKIERTIIYYPYETILFFITSIYTLYFSRISFLRYDNFYAGRFDLGNMAQTVWNTAHGRLFQTNSDGQIVSRLSAHADFILIIISPLYRIWESPKVLLLFQTIVVSLGAFFIFAIAKHVLKRKDISFLFVILYLINPSVERANLFDFHAVTIGTTFLLGTYYFFMKRNYLWFSLLAVLAAITKEQVWAIISLFGLWMLVVESVKIFKRNGYGYTKHLVFACLIFIFSASMFFFLVFFAIPNARGTQHFALSYYNDYGDSPTQIIKNLVFSPLHTVETILKPDRVDFLTQLFLPLSFLSFLSPLYLIFAVPDLLITLLSNNANLHQIYYHYTASITPFLFVSAIYAVKRFNAVLLPAHRIIFMIIIGSIGIYSAYAYGPLPGSRNPNIDMLSNQVGNRKIVEEFIRKIPTKYSVAASNNIGAHLSHRELVFTIPEGLDQADIIVFLLNDPGARPSLDEQKQMALQLKSDPDYIKLFENGDFVAFARQDRVQEMFW